MLSLSSDELVKKRETLDELVKTDGWRLFVQHVINEYKGEGYFARQSLALKEGHVEAIVVHAVALEVERLINWPKDQIRELQGVVDDD